MDTFRQSERSRIMARVRSRGNQSTEVRLVQLLRKAGIAGWRRCPRVYGNPDFAFPERRAALFVDGCFWHGCPQCYRRPKSRRDYWDVKVARNKMRDKRVRRKLRSQGWAVLRIWEHELKSSPERCIRRIRRALASDLSSHWTQSRCKYN